MDSAGGMTDELKQLFDSVAEDLGWLNIDEAEKALDEVSTASNIANKKTKHKTKGSHASKTKKKASRTRKKTSNSSDETCSQSTEKPTNSNTNKNKVIDDLSTDLDHIGNKSTVGDHNGESKFSGNSRVDKSKDPGVFSAAFVTDEKAVLLTDDDEDINDVAIPAAPVTNDDEAVNDDVNMHSKNIDVDTRVALESPDVLDVASPPNLPKSNNEVVTDDDNKHSKDADSDTGVPQESSRVNSASLSDPTSNNEAISDSDKSIPQESPRASLSDLTSNNEAVSDDDYDNQDSDSKMEQVFSVTEGLLHNHKSKTKNNMKSDSTQNRKKSHGDSVVVISSDSEEEDIESTRKSCKEVASFKDYRNIETPENRYVSESSSDDDDKFENFLASSKASSETPGKAPPTQEEMDDFITDDDEPIVISSDDEEEEQEDAVFYYQCNAQPFSDEEGESIFTTPLEEPPKPRENKKLPSSVSEQNKSDDTLYFTPMERPLKPKKFKKPPSSFSQDEDSDDDDFLTPLEKSLKSKKLKKPPNNSVKKDKADDSIFVTPSVRPPLNLKNLKPPNSLSAKPRRPVLSSPSFLASLSTPPKGEYSTSPYVRKFKKNKEALTTKLFKLYNETVFDNKLPSDLGITWNKRLRKTAGYCWYSKSKVGERRQARLQLSEKVCDSAERLRDTLIHELCHAAAWLINGVQDGHGRYWKYWAAKANIAHTEIPVIKRCHSYEVNTKYKYQCARCQTTVGRHSKSIDTEKYCCAYCKGQLVLLPPTNKDETPSRPRAPNKFAMFVKENYASAKKNNSQMKHGDIMRLLSKDFASKAKVAE